MTLPNCYRCGSQPAGKQIDWSEIEYPTTADVIDESRKGSK